MGTNTKDDKGLGRREFIKLGAGGLAVSLTACVASPVEDTPTNTAGGMEPGEQAMPPPDPGDLVDPTQPESWAFDVAGQSEASAVQL